MVYSVCLVLYGINRGKENQYFYFVVFNTGTLCITFEKYLFMELNRLLVITLKIDYIKKITII